MTKVCPICKQTYKTGWFRREHVCPEPVIPSYEEYVQRKNGGYRKKDEGSSAAANFLLGEVIGGPMGGVMGMAMGNGVIGGEVGKMLEPKNESPDLGEGSFGGAGASGDVTPTPVPDSSPAPCDTPSFDTPASTTDCGSGSSSFDSGSSSFDSGSSGGGSDFSGGGSSGDGGSFS